MLDRKNPPTYRPIEQIKLPEIEVGHLSNGVPLHILKAGKQEVCRIDVVFRTGTYYEEEPGQAHFAAKMLMEGANGMSSQQISQLFDQYGAHVESVAGYEFTTLSLYCLSKHLPILLPALRGMIQDPSFAADEFANVKQITLQRVRIENNKNTSLAGKRFRNLIFRNHPYERTLEPEHVEHIHLSSVKAFFERQMRGNYEIFMTGNFSDEHLSDVKEKLGNIPTQLAPERKGFSFETIEGESKVIDKADSLQSSIRYGKVLFGLNHPDYAEFSVLNTLLGGYFGSRLMRVIREEKGFTYGIYSSLIPLRERGFFVIGADVIKEKTEETYQEIDTQLQFLQNELVPEEELETVKNYMLGHFLSSVTTPFAVADKYKSVYLKGLDMNFYDDYFQKLQEVTPKRLQALAKKHLQTTSLNKVTIG